MKSLFYLILFLFIVIVYIHIIYHLKTSNDNEVYDIDYIDSIHLNKICDLRQPFTFKVLENSLYIKKNYLVENNLQLNIIQETDVIEKIEKNQEQSHESNNKITKSIFSEYNHKIIQIPDIKQQITLFEKFIKPTFNITTIHDVIISDKNINTQLKHTYNYRNFFHITEGNITIRFIPPKYSIHLNHFTDYETMHEVSTFDPWNENVNNIKYIEIHATENDTIYIPPYWWYSFQFNTETTIVSYKYRTIMNNITIIPKLIYSFIAIHNKKQNIKTKNKKQKNKNNKKKVKFDEKNNKEF
jgi:hypothetical protein